MRVFATVFAIAMAVSVPLNALFILGFADDNAYLSLTQAGIDDVAVTFSNLHPVSIAVDELRSVNKGLVGSCEPRVSTYCEATTPLSVNIVGCFVYAVYDNDSWASGLVLDTGSRLGNQEQVIVGKEVADRLLLQVGENVSLSSVQLNKTWNLKVGGICHEMGFSISRFCVVSSRLTVGTAAENCTNHVGIKLSTGITTLSDGESASSSLVKEIDAQLSDASAYAPKSQYIEPISEALDNSAVLMSSILSFALIVAAAASFSLAATTIYESTHEIGLMRAIGFSRKSSIWPFCLLSLVVGPPGIACSVIVAYATTGLLTPFMLDITQTLFLEGLPQEIRNVPLRGSMLVNPLEHLNSAVPLIILAFLIVFFSGSIPAVQARRRTLLESLFPRLPSRHKNLRNFVLKGFVVALSTALYLIAVIFPTIFSNITSDTDALYLVLLLLNITSFLWFLSGIMPQIVRIVKLPSRIDPISHELARKSIVSNRRQLNASVSAIALSVMIVVLSASGSAGVVSSSSTMAYAQTGSDILLIGSFDQQMANAVEAVNGIENVSQVMTNDVLQTTVDAISSVTPIGQILSFFIPDPSGLDRVIRWGHVTGQNDSRQALLSLERPDRIVLSSQLAESLGKAVGDSVDFALTESEYKGSPVYQRDYVVAEIVESFPGLPVINPYCLLSTENVTSSADLRCQRIFIRLAESAQEEDVIANLNRLGYYFELESASTLIRAAYERTEAVSSLFFFVGSITVVNTAMLIAGLLVTRVIAQRYVYGLLRAVGFTLREVYLVVVLEGLTIGILGFLVGALCSVWCAWPVQLCGWIPNRNVPAVIGFLAGPIPWFEMAAIGLIVGMASLASGCAASSVIGHGQISRLMEDESQ